MSNFGVPRAIMFILLKQYFVTIPNILNCDQSPSLVMNSVYGNEFVIRTEVNLVMYSIVPIPPLLIVTGGIP